MGKCSALSCPFVSRSSPLPTHAGRYLWTRSRRAIGVLLQSLSLVSLIAWGLYMWVNVKHFGSQPECNHQIKYVVFFFTVRATANWLRRLWIALLTMPVVALFGMTMMILFFLKRVKKEKQVLAEVSNSTSRRATSTEAPRSQSSVGNDWYFRLDTLGIMCVAPSLSLSGHSRMMDPCLVPRYTPQSYWSLWSATVFIISTRPLLNHGQDCAKHGTHPAEWDEHWAWRRPD